MNKKKYKYIYEDGVLVGRDHKKTKRRQVICTDGSWVTDKKTPAKHKIRTCLTCLTLERKIKRILRVKKLTEAEISHLEMKLLLLKG